MESCSFADGVIVILYWKYSLPADAVFFTATIILCKHFICMNFEVFYLSWTQELKPALLYETWPVNWAWAGWTGVFSLQTEER